MNGNDMTEEFVARVTEGMSRRDVLEGIVRGRIASAILTRRSELGMNGTEFARHLGISEPEVREWESGDCDVTIAEIRDVCAKLSLAFDMSIAPEEEFPAGD